MPVGQEYRDLLKLIPAVQVSQDTVRGPSAGGSGQDNVYKFDGVNVTLPLFGTLAVGAGLARHRAGDQRPRRRARGRLRSLGRLHDRLGQQVGHEPLQRHGPVPVPDAGHVVGPVRSDGLPLRAEPELDDGEPRRADRADKLFFFGSYFRPTRSRELQSNAYGDLPDFEYDAQRRIRQADLYAGQQHPGERAATATRSAKRPATSSRSSSRRPPAAAAKRVRRSRSASCRGCSDRAASSPQSTRTSRSRRSASLTSSSDAQVSTALGTQIDFNALDTLGRLTVPCRSRTIRLRRRSSSRTSSAMAT